MEPAAQSDSAAGSHAASHSDILVVLPTYNEAKNLGRLVGELRRLQPEADLLVIDDGSPDGTGRVADELAAAHPCLRVVHRAGKLGLGSAHVLGMDRALEGNYPILLTMDCDFTHRPEDVEKIAKTAAAFKDVEHYARIVPLEEIVKNDFNLNIGRYVDTAEAEEKVEVASAVAKLREAERARDDAKAAMDGFLRELGYGA